MALAGISRRVLAAALIAVLAAALTAAPASAAEYRYVSKGATVQPGKRAGATAWCRGGRSVLGGGVSQEAEYQEASLGVLMPVDREGRKGDRDHNPDDGFKATVDNHTASPLPVRTYAICVGDPVARKLVYRKGSEASVPGNSNADVECPAGSRVVSGGVSIVGGYDSTAIRTSAPGDLGGDSDDLGDDRWIGYVFHSDAAKVTAHVVCARGKFSKGLRYVVKDGNIGPGQGFQQANCPQGKLVVGGGATGSDLPIYVVLSTDSPEDGGDPGFVRDDSWISYADVETGIQPLEVTAICHK